MSPRLRYAGVQLDLLFLLLLLLLQLPAGAVHRHVSGNNQAMALRKPQHNLGPHPGRHFHSEIHSGRPVRDHRKRRLPRQSSGLDHRIPVSRPAVALVEPQHRVVGDGKRGVEEKGEAYVSIAYALVFHLVLELELEAYGVVVPGGGGIVGFVEGRKVKFLDVEGGFIGAEAQPQEQGGEAGGQYEAAAAPGAVAAAVRHGRKLSG